MTDEFAAYPAWTQKVVRAIRARLGNTFILHGNPHDLVEVPASLAAAATPSASQARHVPLAAFLAEQVFGKRQVVIEYHRADGPVFHTRDSHTLFVEKIAFYDAVHGTNMAQSMPRDPASFLPLLDLFLKHAVMGEKRPGIAIILPYAETLIPDNSGSGASPEDRATRVFVQKWATDPILLANDVTIVLVTENLADIDSRIVRSPQTIEIEVTRPDESARRKFLETIRDAAWFTARSTLPAERLAQLTSGLTLVQLRQILDAVDESGVKFDEKTLREHKKAVIEAECFGLLEYVESTHKLDMVAGNDGIKERLRRAAKAIITGRLRGVPMGYLFAGPVGSAKTFMVTCFTGELGFPCVKFLNFRSQWQGATEGNLEKILKLLRAMWPVGVIIDEADAFIGDRNQQGDSGTSNRVFAQLASFMGNTEYRGKILWFLMTCRPDLLPIDIKRQGRVEEHFALFYPETQSEYDQLWGIMLKKMNLKTPVKSIGEVCDPLSLGLSGADLEAILARAALIADTAEPPLAEISAESMKRAFADFIPATSALERELQILASVQECTSREILPAKYRELDRGAIAARVNDLKSLIAG
jgi:SpoVK/Ycf46/Vps4 family AAA+-type ATPase